jgi:hypothetical protein
VDNISRPDVAATSYKIIPAAPVLRRKRMVAQRRRFNSDEKFHKSAYAIFNL